MLGIGMWGINHCTTGLKDGAILAKVHKGSQTLRYL